MSEDRKVRVAVLIGGGGRLKAIYEKLQAEDSPAQIALVVSFKKQSYGLEWATEQGLNTKYLRWIDFKKAGKSREEYDKALIDLLESQQIELVVLAGWGILLTSLFFERFGGRTINVHPALLTETLEDKVKLSDGRSIPVFRGNYALEDALAAGVDTTGCTVHYVTELMDTGPIVLKQEVPILSGDTHETLAERVHEVEDKILPRAIELVSYNIKKP